MGIFTILKRSEHSFALKVLNEYMNYSARLSEARINVDFIKDCIETNLYPKLYWKSLRRSRVRPNGRTLKRYALNQIDSLNSYIAEMIKNVNERNYVVEDLPDKLREQYLEYVEMVVNSRKEKKRIKLKKNLDKQISEMKFPTNPSQYVHNFSSVILEKTELEALSLGPKFCDSKKTVNKMDVKIQFENLYAQTAELVSSSKDNIERFKSTLVDCCFKYLNHGHNMKGILTKKHLEALRKLKTNDNLLITKPDKGHGIVLMDKNNYINKMKALLNDKSKFQKLVGKNDIVDKIEKQLTDSLKEIKQQGFISEKEFEILKPTGTITPRLYGLPKIHKSGLPLRPVLDMNNSAYHTIAKWLVQILKPLHKEIVKHSVKDSFEFVDNIKHLSVKNNFMISLDVSSLFTNIPLLETVEFICKELTVRHIETAIPISALKRLILKCTMNVQFRFDNEYYRQIDGVAMGSPLGPLLADIFLAKLENGPLRSTISHLPTYYRYIDDTFIVLEKECDKDNLLNTFNNVHPSINFTSEDEQNNSISFLDVQLTRRADGTLKRGLHRKSATVQYTHFYSAVPIRYKRNLIKILTHRARRICSEDTIEEELAKIRNILSTNGYPLKFIDKHMMEKKPKAKIPTVPKKVLFIKLQYINETTEEIVTQKLRRAVQKTFNAAKLNTIFYNYPKIRTTSKDRLPEFAKSMCIYQFNCSCGASYIGRTIRQVRHRITGHHPSWLNKGQVKVIKSSILAHLVDTGHQVELNKAFKVIYHIPSNLPHSLRVRLLHIAEAIAIHTHKPDLCIQKKFVQPLSLPWPSV
ncbi:unnamed protein product [Schistosoma spindalis]|nr:unnamed protein product [Schistosoma spindale]